MLNPKDLLIFVLMGSLEETLKADDKELLKKISEDPDMSKGYLELSMAIEERYPLAEYEELCGIFDATYEGLGASLEELKETLRAAVQEDLYWN